MQQQNEVRFASPENGAPEPLNRPEEMRAIRQAMDEGKNPLTATDVPRWEDQVGVSRIVNRRVLEFEVLPTPAQVLSDLPLNERAQELGMVNTHFVNCTGLDDGADAGEHLTTARDIAIMSRELLGHEKIKEYTTIWMDTVRDGQFGLSNTNKLVRFYDGTTGLKTGYTSSAGYCLSASAERGGMELIAVVMHCKTSPDRFESAKALLNYGFANYAIVDPMENVTLEAVPVVLGTRDVVQVEASGAGTVLLDKALAGSVTCTAELDESVQAPVQKGQRLGTLRVEAGGKVLREIELVAAEAVPALGFFDIWKQMLGTVCMAG